MFAVTAVTVSRCVHNSSAFSNPTTPQAWLMNINRSNTLTLLGNLHGVLLRNLINIHKPRLCRLRIGQLTQRPPSSSQSDGPLCRTSLCVINIRSASLRCSRIGGSGCEGVNGEGGTLHRPQWMIVILIARRSEGRFRNTTLSGFHLHRDAHALTSPASFWMI